MRVQKHIRDNMCNVHAHITHSQWCMMYEHSFLVRQMEERNIHTNRNSIAIRNIIRIINLNVSCDQMVTLWTWTDSDNSNYYWDCTVDCFWSYKFLNLLCCIQYCNTANITMWSGTINTQSGWRAKEKERRGEGEKEEKIRLRTFTNWSFHQRCVCLCVDPKSALPRSSRQ